MLSKQIQLMVILLHIDIVLSNPGDCPNFPLVLDRHTSCYENKTCNADNQCGETQKCCENPCGITRCFDVELDRMELLEKCPVIEDVPNCEAVQTIFCYALDCKRCCAHYNKCNPAKTLLTEKEVCFQEICKAHKCKQQGEECHVLKRNFKPYCKCIKKCSSKQDYVCAMNGVRAETFWNECYLNRLACSKGRTLNILYRGVCKERSKPVEEIKKPTFNEIKTSYPLHSFVTINCKGDRKTVQLKWVQYRTDGSQVDVPKALLGKETFYYIDNRKRKVVSMRIPEIGHGSYGMYGCKQYFNGSWLEEKTYIRKPVELIFDRDSCMLPRDEGTCNGDFVNFYYDADKRKCKSFFYEGCSGNANNFQTLEDCQVRCEGKFPTNETKLVERGELCGKVRCLYYSKCVTKDNIPQCICPPSCSLKPDRVCASDGKTYLSLCVMKTIACRWRKPLIDLYTGKCDTRSTTGAYTNNKTSVSSLCDYKACPPYGKCVIHPFTGEPQCYCENRCSFRYNLLCASNMRQYVNECFMKIASCRINIKLTVVNYGLCVENILKRRSKLT